MVYFNIDSARLYPRMVTGMGAQAPIRQDAPDGIYWELSRFSHQDPTGHALFYAGRLSAVGQATLMGSAGESCEGWSLGIIQMQWVETNWASYRGRTRAEGSLLV